MPRIYTFANALRLRKAINYPIPEVEGENINLITITPWTELVNKYTNLQLLSYSPEDMIYRYIDGEIKIDTVVPNIRHKKGQIEILSFTAASRDLKMSFKEDHITRDYVLACLVDDVVYDAADSWYTVYQWEGITKEILYHYKDKAFWYRNEALKNTDIVKECTQEFLEFCFKELHKTEIYRIVPAAYNDPTTPPAAKVEEIDNYRKWHWYA